LFDLCTLIGVLFLSFALRLDYWFYPAGDIDLLLVIYAAPLLGLPVFFYYGFY